MSKNAPQNTNQCWDAHGDNMATNVVLVDRQHMQHSLLLLSAA